MDPLSALIGAGASLLGGFMNSSSAQATNQQNWQNQLYLANNSVSMRVADAKRAGINPLAALGVSSPGFVGATPTDPGSGVAAAGQDLARAQWANKDKEDKTEVLKRELLQAQIDNTNASTTDQMLRNSQQARTFASPGSPPGVKGDRRHPVPMYSYYSDPDNPAAPPTKGLSREYAGTQFGPTAWLTGMSSLPGMIGDWGRNAGAEYDRYVASVRPDVWRNVGPAVQSDYSTP